MALDPLATVADVEARGVTVDASDVGTLTTFLDVASAAVRGAAECPISEATSTISDYADPGQYYTLPGPPVRSVASAELDGRAVQVDLRRGRLFRAGGWGGHIEVTYSHGLPAVPADIVDLVCRFALAGLAAAKSDDLAASRVWQERIGDYFVMYRQDGGTTEMELSEAQVGRLRARFGGGAALLVSR